MLGLGDNSVLEAFEKDEIANPSPRNIYPDRTVYQSRPIERPKAIGLPVLSDFGLARFEGGNSNDDIQPEIYRAPEVLLDMDWSYSVDIWNIGTMVWYTLCNVKSNSTCLLKPFRSGIFSTINICLMLTTRSQTSSQINITSQKWQHTLARVPEDFWKRVRLVGSILTDQVGSLV